MKIVSEGSLEISTDSHWQMLNAVLNRGHWLGNLQNSITTNLPHLTKNTVRSWTCYVNVLWRDLWKCQHDMYACNTHKFEHVTGLQKRKLPAFSPADWVEAICLSVYLFIYLFILPCALFQIYVLHTLAASLSACIYQCLCEHTHR